MPKRNSKIKSGITLIELLIALGIIIVISMAIIPSFSDFSQKKAFNNEVETFVSQIMDVRNKSLSGAVFINGSGVPIEVNWGIQPICTGTRRTYNLGYRIGSTGWNTVTTQTLPAGTTFTTCTTLIFERLHGTPQTAGSITISRTGLPARTITVNTSGRIIYTDSN